MQNGWIKLHRKLLNNPVVKNPKYGWLWVVLLLKASHKEQKFMWNNNFVVLKSGQLITGRKKLAKEVGVSESTLERMLNVLENEQQIEQQKTNKYRLITVINWKEYQEDGQQKEQQMDNRWTTDGQQMDTYKNIKNDKNEKKEERLASARSLLGEDLETGETYKPDHKPPVKKPFFPTELQVASYKRFKCLDYFHKVGIELGFEYLGEEDDQANKRFMGSARSFEKRYGDNWKDVIDWWFSQDNAWCDYHPSNFFSINTYLKYDNYVKQGKIPNLLKL